MIKCAISTPLLTMSDFFLTFDDRILGPLHVIEFFSNYK